MTFKSPLGAIALEIFDFAQQEKKNNNVFQCFFFKQINLPYITKNKTRCQKKE